MNIDTLFTICNLAPLPLWVLLVFVPRWKGTTIIVHSMVIPMMLAVVYLVMMASSFGGTEGDFSSIAGIRALFSDDKVLLAGWIHYLVFDLFVGAWEVRDARRLGIHHLLVIPCLFFTLMAGPVGLLMYFVLRWTMKKQFIVDETVVLESSPAEA